jgi:Gram-negative bacterial TonB protein C-terminal
VASVPFWSHGADVVAGAGSWEDVAPRVVASREPAMAPAPRGVAAYRVVSQSRVSKRFLPVYPEAAKAAGFGPSKCLARAWINPLGEPIRVTVAHCPGEFHAAVREVLMQWRWEPYLVEGHPVPTISSIAIIFRFD